MDIGSVPSPEAKVLATEPSGILTAIHLLKGEAEEAFAVVEQTATQYLFSDSNPVKVALGSDTV